MLGKQTFLLQGDLLGRFAKTGHGEIEPGSKYAAGTQTALDHRSPDLVRLLVSQGRVHMENMQYYDAMKCFEAAVYLDPDHEEASVGLKRAHCKIVPRWHFAMLNDDERNHAYEMALNRAVTSESIVFDIGSGSGLLALIAARAGARQVFSCEINPTVAELAQDTVRLNGYDDRVKIINERSTKLRLGVDLPVKQNLLVTETVDCGLLGEGIVGSIAHAREHLLTEDARIIPCAATVSAVLVESRRLQRLNFVEKSCGFDVSPFNHYATPEYFPVRLGGFDYVELSEPFDVLHFDFAGAPITPSQSIVKAPIKRDGVCHAIIFWFTLYLDDDISVSNQPGSTTHWTQAMEAFRKGIAVRAGEPINIQAEHDCSTISFKIIGPREITGINAAS